MNTFNKSEFNIERIREKASEFKKEYASGLFMMGAIDCIVELTEGSKLCEEYMTLVEPYSSYLSERQGITKMQAIFLSMIAENSAGGSHTSLEDMANHVGCNIIRVSRYLKELEELVKKGVIYACKGDDKSVKYTIPYDFLQYIVDDKPYQKPSYACQSSIQFLQKFYDITRLRQKSKLSTALMIDELGLLMEENAQLDYMRNLRDLRLNSIDEIILTEFCRFRVLNRREIVHLRDVNYLFDDEHDRFNFNEAYRCGTSSLLKKGFMEHAFSEGFASEFEFSLSRKTQKKLLKDSGIQINESYNNEDMISYKNITSKPLYFDNRIEEQLTRLANLLSEKEYNAICKRLQKKGMRQGFACLFYGAPGTGKTESVMQLARKSGRDVMQVNIAEIKSKWVGESEKNIKEIFERYHIITQQSKRIPILLFNEADAIFGRRKEKADDSVDKMENSIQNIILQEMENLKGILIATTNLEQNLDAAFERRFLYKIRFEKPSARQRASIWQAMIPGLPQEQMEQLAAYYDFSGGQIENIARKYNVDCILYGEDQMDSDKIKQYCEEETLSRKKTHQIGFNI